MAARSMTWFCSLQISARQPAELIGCKYPGMAFASVKSTEGLGNLPKVVLTSPHGSEAELYLFGACVTSWKVDSKDLLFVRPDAVFNGQKPIRTSVVEYHIVSRNFGPGPIQQHGFGRNMNWSLVSSANVEEKPIVTLELKDGTYSRVMRDYSFHALYKIILDKKTLSTELTVKNTDKQTVFIHYCSAYLLPRFCNRCIS